jgi:phospholipid/cholesterol/gamma-HCH transport system ATP-binding protein
VSNDNLVEIRDLSFAYGNRPLLKGINLTAPRGKVIAIMGGSGSGKTTLLRLIGGQLRPNAGEVRVDGQRVDQLNTRELYALRRKMGMLFQFGALFTDLSVFDNVAFQMREHTDLPEALIRDLVLMKLQAVGLRGASQMLIMYDEPFTGLDPISLGVIGNLIRRMTDTLGLTSIVVTHDIQESLKIVDYVYFVSNGVIEAEGTPEEILASGAPFVHQFIHGEEDGPVPFHYPAADYAHDLGLGART